MSEDTYHYVFTCDLFKNESDILQSAVEDILNTEEINSVCDINMKTLNGIIVNLSKPAQKEILSVLHQYVKSTNRLGIIRQLNTMHEHSVTRILSI